VSAVEQALAAVRRSGRSADRGEVVHARSSVLVRVEPGPVAVRLPGLTAAFRDAVASAAAEAELATALAQAGTLRACHDALAPLAVDREPLWLLHEARAIARSGDVIDAIDRSLAELAGVPVRPVTATATRATCCGRRAGRCGATGRTRSSRRSSGIWPA